MAYWEEKNLRDIHINLQTQVNALTNWMTTWGFQINASKSVGIIFSRGPLRYDKTIEM
jgi:hypothetical protein